MPVLVTIILFACAIGIALALIALSIQRVSARVIESYKERLDDANTIMNQGSPPDSWVEPFRAQIRGADSGDSSSAGNAMFAFRRNREASAEQIGERARKQCLKRLKALTSFMEKGNFYDEERTKKTVVRTLREEHDRWASCHWSEFLDSKVGDSAEKSDIA